MTELAVRDETAVAKPAAHLPVPAMSDIDSWTQIVGQVIRLANEIYDTPFVPEGLRGSAPAVAAAMLAGREMGLGPMTSLANIDVIRGKPTQKPLLMRAMILSRGHKWEDVDVTDTRAVVRGCRKGESTWTTVTFTDVQARKAGLDLGKYPADKLYARASSRLAKHRFADVIMGMPSSDDVEDGADVEIAIGEAEAAAPAAIEAPKARTAQRAARKAAPPAERPQCPEALHDPEDGSLSRCQLPGGHEGRHKSGVITWGDRPPAAPSGDPSLPPLPGEDEVPTTSGASSSAHAPGSGSPARTAGPSPSGSDGSAPDDTDYDTPGTVATPQITAIWTVLSTVYQFGREEKDQARMVCAQIIGRDLESTKNLSRNEAKAILDALGHWRAQAEVKGDDTRAYLIQMLAMAEEARHGGEVPGEV